MSIASEIIRLKQAKEDIKNSLFEKGCSIQDGATIDTFSDYVDEIVLGSSATPYIRSIPEGAASGGTYSLNKMITSVVIPSGYTNINASEFDGAVNLVTVKGLEGILSIGNYAFRNAAKLNISLNLPNLTSLGSSVFSGTKVTGDVNLPSYTANTIQTGSFTSTKIKRVLSLGSVVTIAGTVNTNGAFGHCTELTDVNLPQTLKSVQTYAFYQSSSLTGMTLPESLEYIGRGAFYGTKIIGEVNLPNYTASTIPLAAFNGTNITKVLSLGSATTIAGTSSTNGAFYGCKQLTEVRLPQTLTTIQQFAFNACTSLSTVYCYATTPPSLVSSSFYRCSALANIYVPEESVNAYKGATGWSQYSDIISSIPI